MNEAAIAMVVSLELEKYINKFGVQKAAEDLNLSSIKLKLIVEEKYDFLLSELVRLLDTFGYYLQLE